MRGLLAVLVLANLLALAWWQGWLAAWTSPAGTADGRPAEIAPERLRVVPLERLDAGASPGAVQPSPIPAAGDGSGATVDASGSSDASVDARGDARDEARALPSAGPAPMPSVPPSGAPRP